MAELRGRELIHQTGMRTFPRSKGIPENFRKRAGMIYVHPQHAHTSIRIMSGKSYGPLPYQQKPYVDLKMQKLIFHMKALSIEDEMLTEENRKDILDGFLQTIKSISDIAYQKRAWILGEPPGTDFDETVNSYSLDADGILDHYKDFKITEIQFQTLKNFDERFRYFYRKNDWPPLFIDTPEWNKITELAKEVLQVFNHEKRNQDDSRR